MLKVLRTEAPLEQYEMKAVKAANEHSLHHGAE